MNDIIVKPIGTIHTPHKDIKGMPILPTLSKDAKGHIELLPEFIPGLKDLEGFSHIILVYHFHKVNGYELQVKPFMDNIDHGIFACKAPKRPNAIGLSTVKILNIKENIINIEQVDMLDGTPLIDIKPFYPMHDNRHNVRYGWLEEKEHIPKESFMSDDRFRY